MARQLVWRAIFYDPVVWMVLSAFGQSEFECLATTIGKAGEMGGIYERET